MFTPDQQARLKSASNPTKFSSCANTVLEEVINQIKLESPELFHTEATMADRVFIHQPTVSDCAGYLVPWIPGKAPGPVQRILS